MFDVTETIEDGYLWNFSPREKRLFRRQHLSEQRGFYRYHQKLVEMTATDNPAIFSNDEPRPSSPFEIKYTFNRIRLNDPRETELTLNSIDPPASQKTPYARIIPWAFEDNTYCQTVVLNGVQTREGWYKRGFNDKEAGQILNALSDKKLTELTFASFPLLTDVTYLKIANMVSRPDNRWEHVTLGHIPVAPDIADIYNRTGKVSYTRVVRPRTSQSFLARFFHLGQENERN